MVWLSSTKVLTGGKSNSLSAMLAIHTTSEARPLAIVGRAISFSSACWHNFTLRIDLNNENENHRLHYIKPNAPLRFWPRKLKPSQGKALLVKPINRNRRKRSWVPFQAKTYLVVSHKEQFAFLSPRRNVSALLRTTSILIRCIWTRHKCSTDNRTLGNGWYAASCVMLSRIEYVSCIATHTHRYVQTHTHNVKEFQQAMKTKLQRKTKWHNTWVEQRAPKVERVVAVLDQYGKFVLCSSTISKSKHTSVAHLDNTISASWRWLSFSSVRREIKLLTN